MTKDTKGPNKDNQGLDMVALLISSNHMVNLILYHHCIRDVISLVVMPFFRGRSCTIKFHTKVKDQGSTHARRHEHPGPSPGALDVTRVFKCLVTNQDSHAPGMVTLVTNQGPWLQT
jgi:hypothetical protein